MNAPRRSIQLGAGAAAIGLIALLIAEKFWIGGRTVYFDDCQKRAALQARLRAAGVPFTLVERDGISLGRVDEKELASRLGLQSLLDVPPDTTAVCK